MFTPQEIQEQTFSKAVFGGYDMQQVDDFLEPLTEDYITLYKENSVLKAKMKILVEKLEEYHWPGNVRELENVIHRLYISERDRIIGGETVEHLLNDTVYEEMLRRYGTGETYTDEAGNECKVLFSLREGVPPSLVARHYAETGVGYVDGKKFIHYRAIKGTSEYSTKEMSVFLDGIISECQEVGVETDTPEQIARYKEEWGR